MGTYSSAIPRTIAGKVGDNPSFLDFAAPPDGVTDQSAALSTAVASVIAAGRGTLYLPGGLPYTVANPFAIAGSNIKIYGDPGATVIQATAAMPTSKGVLDIQATAANIQVENVAILGATTAPTGVLYSTLSGNPLYSSLMASSSVWVHGGAKNIRFRGVSVSHTSGYSIQIDATTGEIFYVLIDDCDFFDNRPFLFGSSSGDLNYGSWAGGVFAHGDGTANMVHGMTVNNCRFKRVSGNAVWTWAPSTSYLHTDVNVTDCYFEDCGLDAIQFGAVDGGHRTGNRGRRIGYVSLSDGAVGAPRWLANYNAVMIDNAGVVINVHDSDNDGISVNGEAYDLDGFGYGSIRGGVFRRPNSTDPEYSVDQIASSGPGGSGQNWFQALATNNTNDTTFGANSVHVSGLTFINYGSGVNLYGARNCTVQDVTLYFDSAAMSQPFRFANIGSGANQIATGNVITKCRVVWNPGANGPVVFEDANTTALGGPLAADYWTGSHANYVYENDFPLTQVAFEKDPNTSSDACSTYHSNSITTVQAPVWFQQVGYGVGNSDATLVWYANVLAAGKVKLMDLQFQSGAPVLSLYPSASNLFGGFSTTSSRAYNAYSAPVGGVYGAGGVTADQALYLQQNASAPNSPGATPGSGGLPPGSGYGAIGHKSGSVYWYYNSTSNSWSTFDFSAAGLTPPGADTQVIINQGGTSFEATAALTFTYAAADPLLTVTGTAGHAAITTGAGYIQSLEGFYVADAGSGTASRSYQCLQIANGGVWAGASIYANNYIWAGRSDGSPGSGGSAVPITPGDALGDGMMYYDTGTKMFNGRQNGAWVAFSTGGSTSPGGSTNSVQVNNGGSFGAGALTFNLSTDVLTVGSGGTGYVSAPGYVASGNSWQAINGATAGAGADLAGYVAAPYGSTGGYVDIAALGYANFPVVLAGSGGFGSTDALLWVSTGNATATPLTSVGLNTNTYINAAAGFYTGIANSQAIQAPNGGVLAQTVSLDVASPSGTNYPTVTLYSSSGPRGRIFGPANSSANLFLSENLSYTGSAWNVDGTSGSYSMIQLGSVASGSVGFAVYCGIVASNPVSLGAALSINTLGNVGILASPSVTAGQALTVAGSTGQPGLIVSGGYAQTAQGFYSPSNSVTAINIPSGGAQFGLDVQARNHYMLGQSGSIASPTAGYGGLTWDSGSNYWYWNGSAWATVNFNATSSVSSVSGSGAGISVSPTTGAVVVTNTGVISVSSGTGISVSGSTGSVTITNSGVTSLAGTANQITVSASTGGITLSLPTNVILGSGTSGALYGYSTAFNAISTAGGLCCRENASGSGSSGASVNDLTAAGVAVINSSHIFVGNGVLCNSYGVQCAGVNPYYAPGGVAYTGQTSYRGSGLSAGGGGYGICGQVFIGGTYYQILFGTEQGVNETNNYITMIGGIYAGFNN